MKITKSIVFCAILFAATNALSDAMSFVPAAEFSLSDTTNGLESSFEHYFAATTMSNDVQSGASENASIKCPIIMCQPRHILETCSASSSLCMPTTSDDDEFCELELGRSVPICMVADDAYVALVDETQTNLTTPGLGSAGEIAFKRPIGPFRGATIKMFTPPIPFLNHNFFAGGQIESIVAVSIVWHTTFETCKSELMDVKKAFERYGIEFDITEDEVAGECKFITRSPTWGGWMVSLSVCRLTEWEFARIMILSRKRPEKNADYTSLVPVDVDI